MLCSETVDENAGSKTNRDLQQKCLPVRLQAVGKTPPQKGPAKCRQQIDRLHQADEGAAHPAFLHQRDKIGDEGSTNAPKGQLQQTKAYENTFFDRCVHLILLVD